MILRRAEVKVNRMIDFKYRKRYLALFLSLALLFSMAGCGSCSTPKDDEPGPQESLGVVKLAVPPEGHIFNMIAEKQGYLAEEGVTVIGVPVSNDTEVFSGIQNGSIDVASTSGTNLPLQYISEGWDLTVFGGYMLTGCMPIISLVDRPWTGLEDLVGCTIACEPNVYPVTGTLFDMGYNPKKDITWLQPKDQAERIAMVERGEADFALVGTRLNYEVITNPNIKVITYASDIMPKYSCCRVEARTEWINENPELVKGLLKAWIRAMAYYDSHHDEVVALVMDMSQSDEAFVRAYMDNPHFDLNIDPMKQSVMRAWDYMDKLGLLDSEAEKIAIGDHINVSLYKQALDECQAEHGEENPKFFEKLQVQFTKNNLS